MLPLSLRPGLAVIVAISVVLSQTRQTAVAAGTTWAYPGASAVGSTPCPGVTLQDCVAAAADGDMIVLAQGVYTESVVLNKAIDLTGAGAGATLQGPGGVRVMEISTPGTMTVRNLTIAGGAAGSGGGIAIVAGAAVTLSNVTLQENFAQVGGGLWTDGPLLIQDSRVLSNASTGDGGGIYASVGLVIRGTEFVNNTGENGGGAYSLRRADVVSSSFLMNRARNGSGAGLWAIGGSVISSTFQENIADVGGGGLALIGQYQNLLISATQVISNAARFGNGGGIVVGRLNLRADGLVVRGNVASGDGGGLWLDAVDTVATNLEIKNNRADGHGGGVTINNGIFGYDLSGVSVSGNVSARSGGGLYAFGETVSMTVSGGRFEGNRANTGGGMALARDPDVWLRDTDFLSNTATGNGGGVHTDGDTSLLRGTFENNRAAQGGGLFMDYGPTVIVSGTQFVGNFALPDNSGSSTTNGGGIYAARAVVDNAYFYRNQGSGLRAEGGIVRNSRFVENHSTSSGGGAWLMTADVRDSAFISNAAGFDGGGIWMVRGDIANSRFESNGKVSPTTNTSYGGAIYASTTVRITDTAVLSNHAELGAGLLVLYGNAPTTLLRVRAEGNSASRDGASLYYRSIGGSGGIEIGQSSFVNNQLGSPSQNKADISVNNGAIIVTHTRILALDGASAHALGINGASAQITNSILFAPNGSAISAGASGSASISGAHNTFVGSAQSGAAVSIGSGAFAVALTNTLASTFTQLADIAPGAVAQFNGLIYNAMPAPAQIPGTLATLNASAGNPRFINPTARDYRIALSSAAADVGVTSPLTRDIDSVARPQGAQRDMGAHEALIRPVVLGAEAVITVGKPITLTAADPGPFATTWQLLGTRPVTFLNAVGAQLTLTPTHPGAPYALRFRFVVSEADGSLRSARTTAVVVTNTAPTAIAGANETVAGGATVVLDGRNSTDADGHAIVAAYWTQTLGPAVTITNRSALSTTFIAPSGLPTTTTLRFSLVVTDAFGARSAAGVTNRFVAPSVLPTATPTPLPTNTATPLPTATNTPTPEPTATHTSTPVPTATHTPQPTASRTPTLAPSRSPTPTASRTPVVTPSRTPTPTQTNTATATFVASSTPELTPTPDITSTPTVPVDVTATATLTATAAPSSTPDLPATATPTTAVQTPVANPGGKLYLPFVGRE
jgi:predicted outer membrane repeat protein